MIDGIVVQPATGSLVHCGQAPQGGSWPLPPPSLAGSQSVSLIRNSGQASNSAQQGGEYMPTHYAHAQDGSTLPGQPPPCCPPPMQSRCSYILFACTRSWAVSEARNWPKSMLSLVHQSQFDIQADVTRPYGSLSIRYRYPRQITRRRIDQVLHTNLNGKIALRRGRL